MDETARVEQTSGSGESLAQVKERLSGWRGNRKRGERIPAALWAAAVSMAEAHGLHRVSQELRLDYGALKKRLGGAGGGERTGQPEARFVELFAAPTAPTVGPRECVVEVENARGAKMRVELNGAGLAGLAGLCSVFWSAP
jgi:hypothetical protein